MKRSEIGRTAFKRSAGPVPAKVPKLEPKPPKGPKLISCKNRECRARFVPEPAWIKVCSPECGLIVGLQVVAKRKAAKEKADRAETKKAKDAIKPRNDYMKEAQAAINAWIRLVRDAGKPCISCGKHHKGQVHAGHYLARGSHPHLALVEDNLALQCAPCNLYLSGAQRLFRVGLIERIGIERVESLECDNEPRKYSIEELVGIKLDYRNRIKEAKL